MAQIFRKTADIEADSVWELDAINLSQTRSLRMEIQCGNILSSPSGTLNIYLQSRSQSGLWEDRIAAAQLVSTGGTEYSYTIQSDVPLGATEEAGPIPGPSPAAAHLTADSVRNGAFPGLYYGDYDDARSPGPTNQPLTGWRIQFDHGGTATYPISIFIDVQEKDVGY